MGDDERDGLELTPMDPAPARPKQSKLPIEAPRAEFGQPLDAPVRKRRPKTAATSAPADEGAVGDYRHQDATRTNIPEAGLATQDRTPTGRVTYAYDPHLDPQLMWAGKAEHTSFEVDTVSLHIHERASTAAILRAVRREEDYDRRSFLISQAFFPGAGPGGDPWKRLSTALRGWVDPDQFEMLRGTRSLPFRAGAQNRIAVKVIDLRGNEAIRILDLP